MYKSPLKIILVVVLFFAVSWAVYYFFYILPGKSQFDIRKFGGNVVSIEDDLVTLNGVFIPAPAGSLDLSAKRNFTFRVDEETRLSKIEIKWPTWEEVAAAPEGRLKFSVEDLPSEQKEGDIEDLKNWFLSNPNILYAEANFEKSIYKSENPVAVEVVYKLRAIPAPSTQTGQEQ
ncbi:MAG: hypothetical protein A2750_00385 [Candidatus Yanofskybacteria bacterium RIFCSPHIGHO2_01_FULL_45_42]|uniref:Uncharacterized protein n=2 Tax=Candidatus Yanofskyibacteriota TaxID=1752733 RepID=A0A1F8FSD2_9BACT|nr:MAG: hypothetical protein A2750_00385 [Candidatus Yanofskybacteria bacterium RIFCSPHIGHO2_01_FULL_45_42]OGN15952.1 MAG: hypothetical protein A3J47_01650 [Candidatus Yanofskybacteria bacterium RIFCSPHIGHO2_02_FULL_43_22]